MMAKRAVSGLGYLLTAVAYCILISYSAAAGAEKTAGVAPGINVLDGRRFAGKLVARGESTGPRDDFVFSDGKFHSRACLAWGFGPGPYWVRLENGNVHFLARLASDENGVMTFRGTVDGPRIDARVEWIKPRWYWTMEKSFSFSGSSERAAIEGPVNAQ